MPNICGGLAILLWGLLATISLLTLEIPPFLLLSMCFFISAMLMGAKQLYLDKHITMPSLTKIQWLIGIIGLFGFHLAYFSALRFAPAIEVSLIVYLWPLFLAVLVADQKTRLKSLMGGTLGLIGITTLLADKVQLNWTSTILTGYGLSICAALIWAGYSWYFSTASNSINDIGWLSVVVCLCSFVTHLAIEPQEYQFTYSQWLGILLLGLGPVGGAFYLWDIGLKQGNRTLLALGSFFTPVLSAMALASVGQNPWSISILVALILIVVGAIISKIDLKLINVKRKSL
ncbi:Permease of the drug/metabolite transporter (DMT) superfamily [Pseudoalteromonas luteoviolacea B = ATCC 29581]|nr:Permease of the drug/metabolite transporter (DMT) superfamily [Pseudoalteromonas luteoviolacea B = ATCC 29581]